ncbi:hypothetical protein X970_22690 [Pseudomonas monteilii SB3101]|uniref:Uncharacterized protein n=1 Tax=Pseudomonas monteilii SB3101 TaxID=1435058 RepID=V9V5A3_9PSED|nr:hypothetical protein X969_23055 [Pseudomonas monteilii SB3078]AHC90086.1 hypothetical protein X970_22690 [Pseudomonas monteilii SB3101]
MPALSGGMKSRWSSIIDDRVEIKDRVAFLRGHARSHRITAALNGCAVPVGAGEPAKGRAAAPKMAE